MSASFSIALHRSLKVLDFSLRSINLCHYPLSRCSSSHSSQSLLALPFSFLLPSFILHLSFHYHPYTLSNPLSLPLERLGEQRNIPLNGTFVPEKLHVRSVNLDHALLTLLLVLITA